MTTASKNPAPIQPEADKLASFCEAIHAAEDARLRVYRIQPTGRQTLLGEADANDFACDPMSIAQRFGGGAFWIQLVDSQGKIVTAVRLDVEAPAARPAAPRMALPAAHGAPMDESPSMIDAAISAARMQWKMEALERELAALRAAPPQAHGAGVSDLMPLLQLVLPNILNAQPKPLNEVAEALKLMREMAREDLEARGDEPPAKPIDWTPLVSIAREVFASMRSRAPQDAQPAPPAAAAPQREPEIVATQGPQAAHDQQQPNMQSALALIIANGAKVNGDPVDYAGIAIDMIEASGLDVDGIKVLPARDIAAWFMQSFPALEGTDWYVQQIAEAMLQRLNDEPEPADEPEQQPEPAPKKPAKEKAA